MGLRFTPLAVSDLEEIGDYIARDNPDRAHSFIAEMRSQCEKIARNPLGYRARPELAEGLRSCAFRHYVILFQVEGADDAFLAGAQRQGDEAPAVEQVGHAARQGGLGHAARTFDQHAAQGRVDGGQTQRQFELVGGHHGGQREMGLHGVTSDQRLKESVGIG